MELLIWTILISGAVITSALAIAMIYACYDTLTTMSQEYRHRRQLEEIRHLQAIKYLLEEGEETEE